MYIYRNFNFSGTIYNGSLIFFVKIHLIIDHLFYEWYVRQSVGQATNSINVYIIFSAWFFFWRYIWLLSIFSMNNMSVCLLVRLQKITRYFTIVEWFRDFFCTFFLHSVFHMVFSEFQRASLFLDVVLLVFFIIITRLMECWCI